MSNMGLFFFLTVTLLAGGCTPQGSAHQDDPLDLWIGQMLLVGFRGTELPPDHPFLAQVRDLKLGGVILFDYDVPSRTPLRNIESADQVRNLTRQLQQAASTPLLIAIDQEGGRIARLKPARGFPETLSQARLGQMDDEQATRRNAQQIAETLVDLGINLNFSPVLDLAINPDNPIIAGLERSYGSDPEVVARHALWVAEEFRKAGVLVCVKHFPGHGSSRDDSHLGLPDVTEDWQPVELEPFRRLISVGATDMVMTAHLFNRKWDSELPATLSPRVITSTLRGELGFDGVVVSDDMQMGAIVDNYQFEASLEMAVQAGVDILAIGNNQQYDPEVAIRAARHLKALVLEGKLSRQRIEASYQRIQNAKLKLEKLQRRD